MDKRQEVNHHKFFSMAGYAVANGPGSASLAMKSPSGSVQKALPDKVKFTEKELGGPSLGGWIDLLGTFGMFRIGMTGGWFSPLNNPKNLATYAWDIGGFAGFTYRWGRFAYAVDGMGNFFGWSATLRNKQNKEMRFSASRFDFLLRNLLAIYLTHSPYETRGAFAHLGLHVNCTDLPMLGGEAGVGFAF
jgi:hypothetical protein